MMKNLCLPLLFAILLIVGCAEPEVPEATLTTPTVALPSQTVEAFGTLEPTMNLELESAIELTLPVPDEATIPSKDNFLQEWDSVSPTPRLPSPTPPTDISIVPPTPKPTVSSAMLPTESILFVQNHALRRWNPQNNEIRVIAENVPKWVHYAGDVAVFMRDISETRKALTVVHIPTGTEVEVFQTSQTTLASSSDSSISISPNGRWLVYAVAEDRNQLPDIVVHEILVQDQQLKVSDPLFTHTSHSLWSFPYYYFTWAIPDKLSWSDKEGIWAIDLTDPTFSPQVVIEPSSNTYITPALNPADQDKEPSLSYTNFLPAEWSPDGRFLLVADYGFESGVFRVIEQGTNQSVEIPNSSYGPISAPVMWLDSRTILSFTIFNGVEIWELTVGDAVSISLKAAYPTENANVYSAHHLFDTRYVRYQLYGDAMIFTLDLQSGDLAEIELKGFRWSTIWWSTDNRFALLSAKDEQSIEKLFIADLNSGATSDLKGIFGRETCCWHWYEMPLTAEN